MLHLKGTTTPQHYTDISLSNPTVLSMPKIVETILQTKNSDPSEHEALRTITSLEARSHIRMIFETIPLNTHTPPYTHLYVFIC